MKKIKLVSVCLLMSTTSLVISCSSNQSASKEVETSKEIEPSMELSAPVEDDASTSVESLSSSKSESSSQDWDAVLDSYEKYVDSYIKLLKKAQGGDMEAMTEYVSMMGQANSLNEKISEADDELTDAQAARFAKIIAKMASAASAM